MDSIMFGCKSIAEHEALKKTSESNNFLYIRLLASTMVVLGHSVGLSKAYTPELMAHFSIFGFSIQGIGVLIFFCLSGYLVTGSICQRRSIPEYIASRAIRIFPGLAVCVIASTVFTFLFLSSSTIGAFLQDQMTWAYLLHNLTLYRAEFNLPGIDHAINGSLWTIPIEARLYLALAGLWLLAIPRSGIAMLAASGAIIYASVQNVLPGTFLGDANFRLVGCFFTGASLYCLRSRIPLNALISAAIFAATYAVDNYTAKSILFFVFVGYTTLVVAYAPKVRELQFVADFSYGIYLYAFVVQTTALHYAPDIHPAMLALISVPTSWLLGAASWHLVEKPCLALKKRLSGPKPSGRATPEAASSPHQ